MMVDNSIITIDNITQRWLKGELLADACVYGTQEIFAPMLSSVLTTCAIFIPLIFLSGIAGALFYDEAMAITITLLSALIMSVLVIPVFYYRFYKNKPCFTPNGLISHKSVGVMTNGYKRLMSWFFRRRGVMWGILAASMLLIGVLFVSLDKQKLPTLSHTDMLLNIEWNERISIDVNNQRCEQILSRFPDMVEQYTSMVGVQQFALSHTREMGPSESEGRGSVLPERRKVSMQRFRTAAYSQALTLFTAVSCCHSAVKLSWTASSAASTSPR